MDKAGEGVGTVAGAVAAASRRRLRPARLAAILSGVVITGFAAGFLHFVSSVPAAPATPPARADAIVALTGGASRIADAVALLEAGRGQRLLITGVHPDTRRGEIVRLIERGEGLFECCVDIDRRALTTAGNAEETRRWVRRNGFRSLIVVTSSYHMPRSLTEIGRLLPDVSLVAYPVPSERVDAARWWASAATARLLLNEYTKYLMALARLRLGPQVAPDAGPGGPPAGLAANPG